MYDDVYGIHGAKADGKQNVLGEQQKNRTPDQDTLQKLYDARKAGVAGSSASHASGSGPSSSDKFRLSRAQANLGSGLRAEQYDALRFAMDAEASKPPPPSTYNAGRDRDRVKPIDWKEATGSGSSTSKRDGKLPKWEDKPNLDPDVDMTSNFAGLGFGFGDTTQDYTQELNRIIETLALAKQNMGGSYGEGNPVHKAGGGAAGSGGRGSDSSIVKKPEWDPALESQWPVVQPVTDFHAGTHSQADALDSIINSYSLSDFHAEPPRPMRQGASSSSPITVRPSTGALIPSPGHASPNAGVGAGTWSGTTSDVARQSLSMWDPTASTFRRVGRSQGEDGWHVVDDPRDLEAQ